MTFLAGYKTYIVAALMVLVGVVHAISGDTTLTQLLNDPNLLVVLNGLGFGFLRAGVAKS